MLAEQAALCSWKIARAERAEVAAVAAAVHAAEAAAGTQHLDEVAAMGHWLRAAGLRDRQDAAKSLLPFLSEDRRDPFSRGRGDPRHLVLRLEASAAGCRLLLDLWGRVRRPLERGDDWRTNELIMAVQLRGERPLRLEVLDWEGLLEPIGPKGDPERIAKVRRLLREQFDEGLPDDPADRRAALMRRVDEETARLEEREAGHRRREAADRAELADRLAVDLTAEGERMRRYQLDFDRKLHRTLNSLLKLRRADGVGVAGDPAPDGPPERTDDEPARSAGRVLCEHRDAGLGPVPVLAEHPATPRSWAPRARFEPESKIPGDGRCADDLLAGGVPSSLGLEPTSILEFEDRYPMREGEAPAEPVCPTCAARQAPRPPEDHPCRTDPELPISAVSVVAAGPAGDPEGDPVTQDEVVRCPLSVVRCPLFGWRGDLAKRTWLAGPCRGIRAKRTQPGHRRQSHRAERTQPAGRRQPDPAKRIQRDGLDRRSGDPGPGLRPGDRAARPSRRGLRRPGRRPGGSPPRGTFPPSRRQRPPTSDGHHEIAIGKPDRREDSPPGNDPGRPRRPPGPRAWHRIQKRIKITQPVVRLRRWSRNAVNRSESPEGRMFLVAPLLCVVLSQVPTTPMSGTVVGPGGEPIAGAEVLLGGLPIRDQVTVARGRTDAEGRFTLQRPAALKGENRYITPILWVVKPGFGLSATRFSGPLPEAGEPVRVVLGPAGKGEVRVEGPDGRPVAGRGSASSGSVMNKSTCPRRSRT